MIPPIKPQIDATTIVATTRDIIVVVTPLLKPIRNKGSIEKGTTNIARGWPVVIAANRSAEVRPAPIAMRFLAGI